MNDLICLYFLSVIFMVLTGIFVLLGYFVNYDYGWFGVIVLLPISIMLVMGYLKEYHG